MTGINQNFSYPFNNLAAYNNTQDLSLLARFNFGNIFNGWNNIIPNFSDFFKFNAPFINNSLWNNFNMAGAMQIGDTFTFSGCAMPATIFDFHSKNTSLNKIKSERSYDTKEKTTNKKINNAYNPVTHNEYITSPYAKATKAEAETMAKKSPHLERLNNIGKNWRLGGTFENDIPYAMKGINELLDYVSSKVGERLIVTSALGTKTSPHAKKGNNTHYNPTNPKIDLGNAWNKNRASKVAKHLADTGLFDFVNIEKNRGSNTYHIDMRFKDNACAILKHKLA